MAVAVAVAPHDPFDQIDQLDGVGSGQLAPLDMDMHADFPDEFPDDFPEPAAVDQFDQMDHPLQPAQGGGAAPGDRPPWEYRWNPAPEYRWNPAGIRSKKEPSKWPARARDQLALL
eukprot:COSAG04_NODE_22981_length_346_cov_0.599190_1_plen_115_part_11